MGNNSAVTTYGAASFLEESSIDVRVQGYKQEMQRKLSLFASFGLSFANIGILSNTAATFQTVLRRGGPFVMLMAWNIVSFLVICVALSLSEICSLYPTSGGLYYWIYELLNSHPVYRKHAPIIAFVTGWTYTMANIIALGANNVIVALSIGSLAEIVYGYRMDNVTIMWTAILITLIHGVLNTYHLGPMAALNQINVFWSCGGLVLIVICLSWTTQEWQPIELVLTQFENRTGFSSPVYVFLLGMIGAGYSLFGFESAAYVNEETKDAEVSGPWAITLSVVTSWLVGLVFITVLLFSIRDMDGLLDSTLDMPVAKLFWDAIGFYGTLGFLVLMIVCQFCTGVASMTGTSRMLYALARDQAVPASNVLKQVNGNHLPGHAVWAVAALTSCLVIAPFPLSESIFEIIISATTITIHFAYAIVLGCRLTVLPYLTKASIMGRFSLGRWSAQITGLGFAWTLLAVFIFVLPTEWPITASTINCSGVALFGVLSITMFVWKFWGKFHYVGPRARNDECFL